jgi:hypothetical protein
MEWAPLASGQQGVDHEAAVAKRRQDDSNFMINFGG